MSIKIIFEGPDRSGKTSIMRRFNERTNYRWLCFDRGPASHYVFSMVYKRDSVFCYNVLQEFCKENTDLVIVYLDCLYETLKQRAKKTNHPPISVKDYLAFKVVKDTIVTNKMCHLITIDTDMYNIDQCCDEIVKLIEEI